MGGMEQERGDAPERADAGDRVPEPAWAPVRTPTAVDAALSLQRAVGNRRTGRFLARKPRTQVGAAPALDPIAAALETELLDPSLAPKVASVREALDHALKVAGAVSSATPQGKVKVPPALKFVNRLWKATDPEERKKLAERLAGRPVVSVLEMIDFTSSVLKDAFDVYLWYLKTSAQSRGL